MQPSKKPKTARLKTPLLLAALALSLTGCASSPQVVSVKPELPTPPVLSTPLPQTTYSESVRALLLSWQKKLTGTYPTSER